MRWYTNALGTFWRRYVLFLIGSSHKLDGRGDRLHVSCASGRQRAQTSVRRAPSSAILQRLPV